MTETKQSTHEIIECPSSLSHTMFSNGQDFRNKIQEGGVVYVEVRENTKTTVHISFRLDEHCFGVDSKVSDEIKYHSPKPEWNYFSGNKVQKDYVKISKKQRFDAIKKHCEETMKQKLKIDRDITFKYYRTRKLNEILEG